MTTTLANDLATEHSAQSDDQRQFLTSYAIARAGVEQGHDVEAVWRRMLAHRDTSPAALAGYVEGLASTRSLAHWGGAR